MTEIDGEPLARGELMVTTARDEDAFVIALRGELDLATVSAVRGAIDSAERTGADEVVLDLGALSFMDSSGVNLLIDGDRRLRIEKRRLRLRGCAGQIDRVLALCGIHDGEVSPSTKFNGNTAD